MSTPSTATAIHPPHHFYPHYPEYYPPSTLQRSKLPAQNDLPAIAYGSYNNSNNSATNLGGTHTSAQYSMRQPPLESEARSSLETSKRQRSANWNDFYKNGLPKEVIVIEDDSPEPQPQPQEPSRVMGAQASRPQLDSNGSTHHLDKRRRVDTPPKAVVYRQPVNEDKQQHHASTSSGTVSSGRRTSGLYSTAPTSLGSTAPNSSVHLPVREDAQAGQKRKRPVRTAEEDAEQFELIAQHRPWSNYFPPPNPPVKAHDVYVAQIKDKYSAPDHKWDDDDGHYIVTQNSDLTERYTIVKLLGQGTFGKVVEAFDRKKKTKCAIKIIRAVPKYRDASRIELRVLATLASNDKANRNKCIHLRDCFDFRNHICIVTDLLGQSVFDFLKSNQFVPFPSTHIQGFARQLLTSVAFLHDLHLIHTDLKPENILLVNSTYQTFTYDRNIPSSSRSTARSAKYRKVLLTPEIRLIDFGSATFNNEYHSSVVSTRHYRAPEIILNLGWSYPCDIWSIGCILVEFFTGDALFQTHDNLEHLAMMEAVCDGKIERDMITRVRAGRGNNKNAASAYFLPRAYKLDYPNTETPRTSKKYVKNMKKLNETIPENNSFNIQFLDLLRRIFVYDPLKRITAKEALQHPWFRENIQDDGTEALKIKLARGE